MTEMMLAIMAALYRAGQESKMIALGSAIRRQAARDCSKTLRSTNCKHPPRCRVPYVIKSGVREIFGSAYHLKRRGRGLHHCRSRVVPQSSAPLVVKLLSVVKSQHYVVLWRQDNPTCAATEIKKVLGWQRTSICVAQGNLSSYTLL